MLKKYIFLLLIFSSSSSFAETDWVDLPFDITNMIETIVSSGSDGIREASDKVREASGLIKEGYQLAIKTEAVQTTINTYKNFLEAVKVYQKTVHLIDIVTGIDGFASALSVAGDHDVRELMGNDWEYMVDEINGGVGTFAGTNNRMKAAFNAFENGNIPYQPDVIYIDPRLGWEKDIYQQRYDENKLMNVESDVALASFSDSVTKINRMESIAATADVEKTRDELRNAIQIASFQQGAERNRLLALQLKQEALKMQEQRQRRAGDVQIAMKPLNLI